MPSAENPYSYIFVPRSVENGVAASRFCIYSKSIMPSNMDTKPTLCDTSKTRIRRFLFWDVWNLSICEQILYLKEVPHGEADSGHAHILGISENLDSEIFGFIISYVNWLTQSLGTFTQSGASKASPSHVKHVLQIP